MTIAVFGATGQLGGLVVGSLLQRGVEPASIRALGRDRAKLSALAARGLDTAVADFDDPSSLAPAVAGAERVLLVSGSEIGRRVPQHQAAIEAARDANVDLLVYTSAPHATTTDFIVAAEHKATEDILVASGIPYVILRNNWYTENYRGEFASARERGVIQEGIGEGRIASAPRSDYAEAAAVVLLADDRANAVLELSGDTAWGFTEFAAAAEQVLGRPVAYTPLSAGDVAAQLRAEDAPESMIEFALAANAGIEGGALADATATLSDLLGRPTEPIETTFRAWASE